MGEIPDPASARTLMRLSSLESMPAHWFPQMAWGRAPEVKSDLALRTVFATLAILMVRFFALRCLALVIFEDLHVAALKSIPKSLCEVATRIVMSYCANSLAMR